MSDINYTIKKHQITPLNQWYPQTLNTEFTSGPSPFHESKKEKKSGQTPCGLEEKNIIGYKTPPADLQKSQKVRSIEISVS